MRTTFKGLKKDGGLGDTFSSSKNEADQKENNIYHDGLGECRRNDNLQQLKF